MAEVVGTAYVRIRAITAQLRKDIEDAVNKGARDADVDGAAETIGRRFSRKVTENIGDDISESIGNALVRVDADRAGALVASNYVVAFHRRAQIDLGTSAAVLGDVFSNRLQNTIAGALGRGDFLDFDFDLDSLELTPSQMLGTGGGGERTWARAARELGEGFAGDFIETTSREVRALMPGSFGGAMEGIADDEGTSWGRRFANRASAAIRTGFNKSGPPLDRFLRRWGEKHGNAYGGGFRGSIVRYLVALAPALVAPLAGIIQLITQYVITLIGQIGFLVTAAVGAGTVMGAAFGAAALAIIPLLAAFTAQTPELDKLKKSAKDLADVWEAMAVQVQRRLFPALEETFDLIENDLRPALVGFGAGIGDASADLVRMANGVIRNQAAAGRLNRIWVFSVDIFREFGTAAVAVFDGLITLFDAALPLASRFADSVTRLAFRWNEFITRTADSGELGAQLQLWYDRAVLVWHILGDIAHAIWNIFTIGAEVTTPFFDRFAEWAQQWRDFTESTAGRNRIKEVFEEAAATAHEFNALVSDIFSALFESATDGDGSLVSVLRSMREDWLPAIDDFLTRIAEQTGPELARLFISVGEVMQSLADSGALSVTATIISGIATALSTLISIPGVGQFVGILLGIAGAFRILSFLRIPEILLGISRGWQLIAGAFGGPVAAGIIGSLAALGFWIQWVRDRWGDLTSFIPLFVGPLGIAGFIIGAVSENFQRLQDILGTVVDFISDVAGVVGGALSDAFGWLLDNVLRPVGDFLSGAFTAAWEAVTGAVSDAVDFITSTGSSMFDGIAGAVDFIWNDVLVPFGNFLSAVFPTLWDAAGSAISWFSDNILTPLGDAVDWLWNEILVPFGDWLGTVMAPVWDAVVDVWQQNILPILRDIGDMFQWFMDEIGQPVIDWIRETFGPVWEEVVGFLQTVVDFVRDHFTPTWATISAIFGPLVGIIVGFLIPAFQQLWDFLAPFREWLANNFADFWNDLVLIWNERLWPAIQLIAFAIQDLWQTYLVPFWNWLMGIFAPVWHFLVAIWSGIVQPALRIIGAVITWLWNTIMVPVWNWIQSNAIPILTFLATAFTGTLGGAIRIVGGIISLVWNTMFRPFLAFLQGAFTLGIRIVQGAWNAFTGAVRGVIGAAQSLWNGVLRPFLSWLQGAGSAAIRAAKSAWDALTGAIRGIIGVARSAWDWVQRLIDAIGNIPSLPDLGGGGVLGSIVSPLGSLFGANGGIFDRATPMIIGEAGREVLLPLTRPQRARELAAASGAYDVLLGGGSSHSISFSDGAIVLQFNGAQPTTSEARRIGQSVGDGIADVLARRRITSGARSA